MITMPGETAGVTMPEIHGSRFSTGTAQNFSNEELIFGHFIVHNIEPRLL